MAEGEDEEEDLELPEGEDIKNEKNESSGVYDDKERLKIIIKNKEYAENQADKQIVYLAGGALGLTVVFLKNFIDIHRANIIFLEICWFLLTVALCLNLYSHVTSIQIHDAELSKRTKKEEAEIDQKRIDRLNKRIDMENIISLTSLYIGIFSFMVFMVLNLNILDAGKYEPDKEPNKKEHCSIKRGDSTNNKPTDSIMSDDNKKIPTKTVLKTRTFSKKAPPQVPSGTKSNNNSNIKK
jgi:hypothetical protein